MSRNLIFAAAVAAVLATGQLAVSNPEDADQPAAIDAMLEPGQIIGLTPAGDRYSVAVNPRWRTGNVFTVVSVQPTFIVLENQSKETELRIPLWSIREVTISKTGIRS